VNIVKIVASVAAAMPGNDVIDYVIITHVERSSVAAGSIIGYVDSAVLRGQ